jgi:2-(1,2-epoxy-1,2-dihydrophenyl)acetyl-CoA isomerase
MADPDPAASLAIEDGIGWIRLNRPARLNAFDAAMHADLREALNRVEQDPGVRAVVLTGTGRAFSAGQDLAERHAMLQAGDVDLGALLERDYNALVRQLATLPIPVIAAVNGVASGAASAVALGCDIVLAARSAVFQFPFARIGLGPDAGASWLLPRLAGPQRAMALGLTGGSVDAATAAAWGMIWRVVEDESLIEEATLLARQLAAMPREALATMKARLRDSARLSFDEALDAERDAQAIRGRSTDYRDAVKAFAEKRTPRFEA